jgi:hypothetical protein
MMTISSIEDLNGRRLRVVTPKSQHRRIEIKISLNRRFGNEQ